MLVLKDNELPDTVEQIVVVWAGERDVKIDFFNSVIAVIGKIDPRGDDADDTGCEVGFVSTAADGALSVGYTVDAGEMAHSILTVTVRPENCFGTFENIHI